MRRFTPIALIFAFLFVLGACGSSSTVASKSSTAKTTTTVASADANSSATTAAPGGASATVVDIKTSSLGKIITNGSGQTLYEFTPDTATSSACTGGCASAWPPAVGPATAGSGVDASDLGTVTRADGTTQATLSGHPLYTFSGDTAPGDVNGQGTGGKWYVLDSEGNPVTGAASSPTTMAPTTTDASGY
jgi:predicted lipoprotein with Yx(FWY)xxD motif